MDILIKIKQSFFDRDKVVNALRKAQRREFSRYGAFVRTAARTSMRRRKQSSEPGNPPSAHVGTLRDLLFFSWDGDSLSVVVGPATTRKPTGVPHLLEMGGIAFRPAGKGGIKPAKYPAYPYMQPAFKKTVSKLGKSFRGSVR